jgi:hypothetical protein
LHLGEGRRRLVTKWRRSCPELQQALKALNPEWRRPRLGALVEDGDGDHRQTQQCLPADSTVTTTKSTERFLKAGVALRHLVTESDPYPGRSGEAPKMLRINLPRSAAGGTWPVLLFATAVFVVGLMELRSLNSASAADIVALAAAVLGVVGTHVGHVAGHELATSVLPRNASLLASNAWRRCTQPGR